MDPLIVSAGVTKALEALAVALSSPDHGRPAKLDAAGLHGDLLAPHLAARRDSLTGLLNRRGFVEFGSIAISRSPRQPRVIIQAKIENFERVSITYGQRVSDQAMIALSRRIADYCTARLVARIGDDHFAALVPSTISPRGVHYPHTRDLASLLNDPICLPGNVLRLNVSITVTNVERPDSLVQAIHDAEAAPPPSMLDSVAGDPGSPRLTEQRTVTNRTDSDACYRSRRVARHPIPLRHLPVRGWR